MKIENVYLQPYIYYCSAFEVSIAKFSSCQLHRCGHEHILIEPERISLEALWGFEKLNLEKWKVSYVKK